MVSTTTEVIRECHFQPCHCSVMAKHQRLQKLDPVIQNPYCTAHAHWESPLLPPPGRTKTEVLDLSFLFKFRDRC